MKKKISQQEKDKRARVEEKQDEIRKKKLEEILNSPPPRSHETYTKTTFEFGKPGLKHKQAMNKVVKLAFGDKVDYNAMLECAKARKISIDDFIELDEEELTDAEKRKIISGGKSNEEFAALMNDILTESLYATIKKNSRFEMKIGKKDISIDEFEEQMDDYAEAVELFPIAVKWIMFAYAHLSKLKRPN